jgi:hypothetical protein
VSAEAAQLCLRCRTRPPAPIQRIDGKCAWCLEPMPVPVRPQGGGRTKKFCSDTCRQAEHRHRKHAERTEKLEDDVPQ